MSELENSVKPIIRDMVVHRSAATLHAQDIEIIAAYAVKQCMLADYMQDARAPFFSFSDSLCFRQTLVPPDGFQMWLATSAFRRGLFVTRYYGTPLGAAKGFELNCFTYAVGYLVFQVTTTRYRKQALRKHADRLALRQSKDWDAFSIPAWPLGNNEKLLWPPISALTAPIAETFVDRWESVNDRRGF